MSRTYDRAVIPLILAAAGVLALGVAAAILRTFGPRYRVGRLLAVARRVPVAEAVRMATAGEAGYVRVDGRIDSDAEFEDADHRPLVVRRTSLRWRAAGGRGRWTMLDASTEAVPFVVREGLDEIGVDADDLTDGLVVVPRLSGGRADDLGEHAPAGIPPDAEVQLGVEQVSSVEHAIVAGMPRRTADGRVVMGPGLGRPLLLTTLERDEALRVLTGGATIRSRLAVTCLAAGALLLAAAALSWLVDSLLGGPAVALAASPDPTLRPGGDTRTGGSSPGFVGEPLLAILGVLAVGAASLLATLAYVRLTAGRARSDGPTKRGSRPGR